MYFSNVNPIKTFYRDPYLAWDYFVISGIQVVYSKLTNKKLRFKHYAGKEVLSSDLGNSILTKQLNSSLPYMSARFGSNELLIFSEAILLKKKIIDHVRIDRFIKSCLGCGLFPISEKTFIRFADEMILATQNCDMMGVWYNIFEEYSCKKYLTEKSILTHRSIFDFWIYEEPFTVALKGKKVLVIHPLSELIQSQYKKRKLLFKNPKVLPDFNLKTLKAVQTIAGEEDVRFADWFEALDYMFNEAMKIDFDIAILGCGAYGFPLAAKLKRAGKIAIHMGGVTQILFGIKGARWDSHPEANKLYNEHWVRPADRDRPSNFEKVEDGCYW